MNENNNIEKDISARTEAQSEAKSKKSLMEFLLTSNAVAAALFVIATVLCAVPVYVAINLGPLQVDLTEVYAFEEERGCDVATYAATLKKELEDLQEEKRLMEGKVEHLAEFELPPLMEKIEWATDRIYSAIAGGESGNYSNPFREIYNTNLPHNRSHRAVPVRTWTTQDQYHNMFSITEYDLVWEWQHMDTHKVDGYFLAHYNIETDEWSDFMYIPLEDVPVGYDIAVWERMIAMKKSEGK